MTIILSGFGWLQFSELLVASYNANEDMPHDPDGVALVWNVKFKKTTPDYVFHCQVSYVHGEHGVFLYSGRR